MDTATKMATGYLLVLTNVPDAGVAEQIAALLVGEGLAACVNILAPCRSVYRWQGEMASSSEIPLLIKTRESTYQALEESIRRLHPYDIPEIIALPIVAGLDTYLNWLDAELAPTRCTTENDD